MAPAETTRVTIDGSPTVLAFGMHFDVRYGRDATVIRDVRLDRRERNGDLVFVRDELLEHSSSPRDAEVRVRPSTIDAICGSGVERAAPAEQPAPRDAIVSPARANAKTSVVRPRRDGETAAAYLADLERALGPMYARWIGTGAGQDALAAAAAEDREARRAAAKVSKRATGLSIGQAIAASAQGVADANALEEALARGVELADALAPELGYDPDAVAARVVEEIPELATPGGAPSGFSAAEEIALASTEREPKLTRAGRAALVAAGADPDQVAKATTAVEVDGVVVAITEHHDATAPKPSGRPYSERNQVWRCGTCKRRTRAPFCANGHEPVNAPAGKRREDRLG